MTLLYFNNMFLFIKFLVCSSSIFDVVMIDNVFMHMFAKCLLAHSSELSGCHNVSVVLICCLLADAPYTLGHVVDRRYDTPNESSVVPYLF